MRLFGLFRCLIFFQVGLQRSQMMEQVEDSRKPTNSGSNLGMEMQELKGW